MSFPSQGYTPTTIPQSQQRDAVAALARTANQEWFASDIVPLVDDDFESEMIIQFAYDTKAILEVTLDSGATWFALNNKFKFESETINNYVFHTRNTDLVNFRSSTAGTIRIARVMEKL